MKKILLSALVLASLAVQGQVPTAGLFAHYPFTTANFFQENTAPNTVDWNLIHGFVPAATTAPNTEILGAADFTINSIMIARGTENPLGKHSYAYSFWIEVPLAFTNGDPTVLRVGESIAFQLEVSNGNPQSPEGNGQNSTTGISDVYNVRFTSMHYDSLYGWQGNFDQQVWSNAGGSNLVDATQWMHVAVVYQGNPQTNTGLQTVYLNGQYAYENTTSHSAVIANETYESNLRTIRVGGDVTSYSLSEFYVDNNRFFTGKIDELYIYTQAITAANVSNIYYISAPAAPIVSSVTDTVYYCDGVFNPYLITMGINAEYTVMHKQNGVVVSSGSGPASFFSFTPTEGGQSTVDITNGYGTSTVTIAVLPSNLNQLAIVEANGVLSLNELPTQITGSYYYIDWYKDGQFVATGTSIPVSGPGSYTAYIYYQGDTTFCTRTTDAFIVTGIGANTVANSISLFPNPATNMVTINTPHTIANISVYDVAGKLVMGQNNTQANNINLDIATLSNGFYTVQLYTTQGSVVTKKLIKQ